MVNPPISAVLTLTFADVQADGTKAILAALVGTSTAATTQPAPSADTGTTTTGAGTTTGTPATTTTAADPAFPPNAGDAPFPSPENSRILRADGVISGKPYLLDGTGAVHTLGTPHPPLSGYYVNGHEVLAWDSSTYNELLVRGGKVYAQIASGQWTLWDPARGSTYNADLPDASTGTASTGATAAAPAPIAASAASAIQPGTSGRTLTAAPGSIATVLGTAQDGDTIVLDGAYAETVPTITVALKVQLKAGTVLDFTNQTLAMGKGGFVPTKDFWLDGPGTIKGAGIKETYAGGTAAVRHGAACAIKLTGGLTLTGNQNGFAGGEFSGCTLDMTDVTLDGNGLGDGQTHNLYAFAGMAKVTGTRLVSRNAKVGHEIKTRCGDNTFTDCTFTGAPGGQNPDDSSVVDLPDGGNLLLVNTTVTKQAGALNHSLIGLSMESQKLGAGVLTMQGGTLDGECDNPLIQGTAGTKATLQGVTFKGTKPAAQGCSLVIG